MPRRPRWRRCVAVVLDATLPDENLRAAVFSRIPRTEMAQALDDVRKLVRPPDDVFYRALDAHYRRVRRFLPALLKHVSFIAAPAGGAVEPKPASAGRAGGAAARGRDPSVGTARDA